MTTHLVIPDTHAKPKEDNSRATLLGKLINDLNPDVVVNLGDTADMHSLNTFEKGKGSFHAASYSDDINAHLDFQDRIWNECKSFAGRKVVLVGNHEYRIHRLLEQEHQLKGDGQYGISFSDLRFDELYHDVVDYEGSTPGTIQIDGIVYAHFLASGAMARPISGDNHARSLLMKGHTSATVGHSHFFDFSTHVDASGKRLMGLVAGCYKSRKADAYAGTSSRNYWRGVCVKRQVQDGTYDLQMISMDQLESYYI